MRVAYVPDLLDRSRFNGVADLIVVNSPEAINTIAGLGPADIVAVDLSRDGALTAAARAASRGATVYGFASHVDDDTINAAKAEGVIAMARSVFFRRVGELMS